LTEFDQIRHNNCNFIFSPTKILSVGILVLLTACSSPDSSPVDSVTGPAETLTEFESQSGEVVEAYRGMFEVPENRSVPDSRMLTLHYLRFPSTSGNPGAPIVYLAGGPGGSGIWFAGSWRFPLFMALREFGDVIALDQRGTGASDDTPACTSSKHTVNSEVISDQAFVDLQQQALRECIAYWQGEGIDLAGYNTQENAADLDALRHHLRVDKLSLWGISYGSHLALAALRQMDGRIDRVIIASAEGLDQTIKLPSRTDEYFGRLQDAIDSESGEGSVSGELTTVMRRVHARLEKTPLELLVPQEDGDAIPIVFQRRDMQRFAAAMIADPNRFAAQLVRIYIALDEGKTGPLTAFLQRWETPNAAISFEVMPVMMDIASGVSSARRVLIEQQAQSSLLGQFLNDTLYLIDAAPSYDLGDTFRQKPVSNVPLLLLSGTLDGRTYIDSQREAVSGLKNRQIVTVTNGGHNLFMVSPEVTEAIREFMRGEPVDGREIVVDVPEF
jgi:pimeloyl-ACP methyl ester carboxylesterase